MNRNYQSKPATLIEFDNHVSLEALEQAAKRRDYKDIPNKPYYGIIHDDNHFYILIKMAIENIPQNEKAMSAKAIRKWTGPQGGTISKDTIIKGLLRYLQEVETDEETLQLCLSTAEKIFQRDIQILNRGDYRLLSAVDVWKTYRRDHRSSQSSLGVGDRRDREFMVKSITLAMQRPLTMDPIIANGRFKDGKYRNIFNDPLSNYFREAKVFSKVFDDWVRYDGDIHYSDMDLGCLIESLRAKGSSCTDFQAMDTTMSELIVTRTALSMIKAFGYDLTHADDMVQHISALLSAPLIVADEVWYAVWNWLSGIFPTHNVEGYLGFSIAATAAVSLGYRVVLHPKHLRENEVFILVCGDDSGVLFGHNDIDRIKSFAAKHAELSSKIGLVPELSKTEISTETIGICKKLYALSTSVKDFKHIKVRDTEVSVYKYPLIKALNSLYHPENMPVLPWDVDRLKWMTGILSCARGCQNFHAILDNLYLANADWLHSALVDWNTYHKLSDKFSEYRNQDWWYREMGSSDDADPALAYLLSKYL